MPQPGDHTFTSDLVNLTDQETRVCLTRDGFAPVLRILKGWNLTTADKAALLGLKPRTLQRYIAERGRELGMDSLTRMSLLVGIDAALSTLRRSADDDGARLSTAPGPEPGPLTVRRGTNSPTEVFLYETYIECIIRAWLACLRQTVPSVGRSSSTWLMGRRATSRPGRRRRRATPTVFSITTRGQGPGSTSDEASTACNTTPSAPTSRTSSSVSGAETTRMSLKLFSASRRP